MIINGKHYTHLHFPPILDSILIIENRLLLYPNYYQQKSSWLVQWDIPEIDMYISIDNEISIFFKKSCPKKFQFQCECDDKECNNKFYILFDYFYTYNNEENPTLLETMRIMKDEILRRFLEVKIKFN